MDPHYSDWLNLALRWFHLIAGIAWIGSSFYFMWLDASLEKPAPGREGVEGELWMTHSGGFYRVEKRLIRPGELPKTLHWFKWEATFTWISGIFLLAVVYYLDGGRMLVDSGVSDLSPGLAIGVSVGVIILSWFAYDLLWLKPYNDRQAAVATVASTLLLGVMVWGLCALFAGRAAYIHTGAILGSLMVANVWVRILPAQQQMIDSTQRGEKPDYSLGLRAKRRSTHNSYLTLPVIFMMLSSHYPSTYGHALNWLILLMMVAVGGGIRHIMLARLKGRPADWVWAPVAALIVAVIWLTAPPKRGQASTTVETVTEAEAVGIIRARCQSCHATQPTEAGFAVAPAGVKFDEPGALGRLAERILIRAVVQRTMPPANSTGMTDAERDRLGRWLEASQSGTKTP